MRVKLTQSMNTDTNQIGQSTSKITLASQYRTAHQHRLMLLINPQGELPTRSKFCRIKSVETLAPDLWVTVGFFDGSTKGLRPDKIRPATKEEEGLAKGLLDPQSV